MGRNRVFFDGAIRWEDEALISPLSTGLLYGDGIFEILRSYKGIPYRFADHYEKIRASCEALRLGLPYDEENMWLVIRELLRQNELDEGDGYIRLTVFGAELNLISNPSGVTTHTFAHVRRFIPPKPDKYKRGIKVRVSGYRSSPYNPTAGHNTICYLPMILARRSAWDRGLDEVLIQSTEGGVTEGSTSNVFMVNGSKLITPPKELGIQSDVSRKVVMEIAEAMKIPVKEKNIGIKSLLTASEVFITNSLIEIMPVREIDGNVIGTGRAGTITKALIDAYQEKIKLEAS